MKVASNKIILGASSVIVLIAAVFYIISSAKKHDHPLNEVYFINDATMDQTLGPGNQFPPVAKPEGELVWAFYYSCDGCTTRKLGYLQKYSPEGKKLLEESAAHNNGRPAIGDSMAASNELWVRTPVKGSTWYLARSQEGRQVIAEATCAGHEKDYAPCPP